MERAKTCSRTLIVAVCLLLLACGLTAGPPNAVAWGAEEEQASTELLPTNAPLTVAEEGCPYPNENAKILEEGTFADNRMTWKYYDDATLVIEGTGAMPNFTTDHPWVTRHATIEHVIVGNGITTIGDHAFYDCRLLEYASLPEGLISIGSEAFKGCEALEIINERCLPDSIKTIGNSAFEGCAKLNLSRMPNSIVTIGSKAFYDCKLLNARFVFPTSLRSIGEEAFRNCGELKIPVLNEGLETIGKLAFFADTGLNNGAPVNEFVIPGTVTSIGDAAFGFSINNLILAEGITNLDLTDLSDEVDYIHIPATMNEYPATRNPKKGFIVADGNQNFAAHDGILYSRTTQDGHSYDTKDAVLFMVPTEKNGTLILPDTTKVLDTQERYCKQSTNSSINALEIPATVEQIVPGAFSFAYRSGSTLSISLNENNANFVMENGMLYSKDHTRLVFVTNDAQGSYTVPSSVTSIDDYAFTGCLNLTEIIFTPSLKKLPSLRFQNHNSNIVNDFRVANFYVPAEITSIEYGGIDFGGWEPLPNCGNVIFYGGTKSNWKNIYDGTWLDPESKPKWKYYYEIVKYGKSATGVQWCIDKNGLMTILTDGSVGVDGERFVADVAEEGSSPWSSAKDSISKLVIEDNVCSVGANAFKACSRLTNVTLGADVSSVGADAFKACSRLTNVTLGANVSSVGAGAFKNCTSLTQVDCPDRPFEVAAANAENPSFDAETVTLHAVETEAWKNASGRDNAAGTWQGYKIEFIDEQPVIPETIPVLKSYRVDGEMWEHGIAIDGCINMSHTNRVAAPSSFKVNYYAEDGRKISDLVNVEITPSVPSFSEDYRDIILLRGVYRYWSYDTVTGSIPGYWGMTPAGVYTITATPKEGVCTGDPISFQFTVKNDPSILAAWKHIEEPVMVYGGNDEPTIVEQKIFNQYGDLISAILDMQVTDETNGKDITDNLSKHGLSKQGNNLAVDAKAIPGKYGSTFTDPAGTLRPYNNKNPHIAFEVKRSTDIINKAYSLELTGGEDVLELGKQDTWASKPFRTKILDAYDDPCWPEVTWTVKQGDTDVTSYFEVDSQGYLLARNSVADLLGSDGQSQFTITASSPRAAYHASRVGEFATDSKTFTVKLAEPPAPPTHTATFVIGDEVIGTVTFAEGDATLNEPAMPQKPNYLGSWEPYDLSKAKSDITVQGVYTPMDPNATSEVEGSADVSYDKSNVTIHLAASAATRLVKVESTQTQPIDVVMVLDQSRSMTDRLGESTQIKRDALVACAKNFAQQLYANAEKTGARHRVALVGFANESYTNQRYPQYTRYYNTELLAMTSGGGKGYQSLEATDYQSALLPIEQNGGLNPLITQGLNAVKADGATAANLGLEMASSIFANNSAIDANGKTHKRVVLFITDGTPTMWGNAKEQIAPVAADAIKNAYTLKNSQDADIYSIGVDASANPSAKFTSPDDGITTISYNEITYDFNRFLHAVSSNYPNAESMARSALGEYTNGGYYMAVNDTSNFSSVFTNILYSTVYRIKSFDKATLQYTLPAGLMLTMEQEEQLRANLAKKGMSDQDLEVTAADGKTTLVFRNVPVSPTVAGGVQKYLAEVTFQAAVTRDVSGSIAAGENASVSFEGETTSIAVPSIKVPADRCLVVFKVNDAVYEVRELAIGDVIKTPDSDYARWLDLEQREEPATVTNSYTEFITSTLTRQYSITYCVGDQSVVKIYKPGTKVTIPNEIKSLIPEGHEIASWDPSVPQTMPARNLQCTAVLTKPHEHAFKADSYKTGSCDDAQGVAIHDVCACGEEQIHYLSKKDHDFVASMVDSGNDGTKVTELKCNTCGHSIKKNITYRVTKKDYWDRTATVLDLTKRLNKVEQSGPSDDDISLSFYVGDTIMNGACMVTRIDADGKTKKPYLAFVRNGWLTFDPDHFSIYVISERADNETAEEATEKLPSYEECLEALGEEREDEPQSPAPSEPENPVDPVDPVYPSTPSGPDSPTIPAEPSTPSEPSEPSDPVDPAEPSTPDKPDVPPTPDNPSTPDDPAPSAPSAPSTPSKPSAPQNPDIPSTAGNNNDQEDQFSTLPDGWTQDPSTQQWHYVDNGQKVADTWLQTGADKKWYYLGSNGAAATGWKQLDGNWYYFQDDSSSSTDECAMAEGGWHYIQGDWYYMSPRHDGTYGAAMTGWVREGTRWYYLNTAQSGGKECAMATGWKLVDGDWYYFNTPEDNGVTGAMADGGWKLIQNRWYYINPRHDGTHGAAQTGWVRSGSSWYYLNTAEDSGVECEMAVGWKQIAGKWYYLRPLAGGPQGSLATNTWVGSWHVDRNGVWDASR
ncbi:leucine-rich repeat protein [Xiamenia xianingshaonis]|uniref:Leucine-rich repeat protein n=1 Tax=Xiamenia xianingshaonis TaxID=2682776 RepID=A0A9E6MR68_9ACTN|nr:leucine-rich repeat protein [Xiamenia xianingshaonis]NHM15031.1 leucine-rich repeat protein [Xiamenia xianingshaonis]QTU84454.1 leucine-rich repeat protein [Xiamenia xianingshaonis]